MKKSELKKILEPPEPGDESVKVSYTVSEDARKVKIEFDSDVPMNSWDVVCLLCDFINDFVSWALKGQDEH